MIYVPKLMKAYAQMTVMFEKQLQGTDHELDLRGEELIEKFIDESADNNAKMIMTDLK